jgi:hypothetical protein
VNPPFIPKPHQSKVPGWVWLLIALVVVPLLGAVIGFVGFRMSSSSAVAKLEQQVHRRGEPLTLAQLQKNYPAIPDQQNAAVRLMAAWEKRDSEFWKAFRNGVRPMPPRRTSTAEPALAMIRGQKPLERGKALPESERQKAEAYLGLNHQHMLAVSNALQLPQCRFPVKYADGYAALLPHLVEMKLEAQRFSLASVIAADKGDAQDAIVAIRNTTRVADALHNDPFLIGQLVRVACVSLAIGDTQYLLSRDDVRIEQLDQLNEILGQITFSNSLKRSFVSERAAALSVFDLSPELVAQIMTNDSDPDNETKGAAFGKGMNLLDAVGFTAVDKRFMMETLATAIHLADEDSPEALARLEQLFRDVRSNANKFPPKIFSGLLLPALERAAERFATCEARRRAAVTALAVEKFRKANSGKLPATLAAVVPSFLPAIPVDPFDGKPIRYRQLKSGFVVYSVGVDRRDDGGKERARRVTRETFDDGFFVER